MHQFFSFPVDDIDVFKQTILKLSETVKYFCYLDSNNYPNYPYSTFGSLFAIDAIHTFQIEEQNNNTLNDFQEFIDSNQSWLFGFLNYDLKNMIENKLNSQSDDFIQNPLLFFFVPKYIIKIENNKVEIGVSESSEIDEFKSKIKSINENKYKNTNNTISIHHKIQKSEYIDIVKSIQNHIQLGDIYELNLCQEFYANKVAIDEIAVFEKLNKTSKAPFSCFLKNNFHYLMCASPERFLKKQNKTLISQPIKGTRKRGKNTQEDRKIKNELFFDEKERSENVMIVDLVRNDMSKIALKNSVEVDELYGLYTFEQVHQLISTISCSLSEDIKFVDIVKAMFPMGSMTGAPKMAAMQLIEQYEKSKRGLFSGCVGYITPKQNFDFNVVIRSILYNKEEQYLSIQTGSAITIDSDAELEYEECLIKANAMIKSVKK